MKKIIEWIMFLFNIILSILLIATLILLPITINVKWDYFVIVLIYNAYYWYGWNNKKYILE